MACYRACIMPVMRSRCHGCTCNGGKASQSEPLESARLVPYRLSGACNTTRNHPITAHPAGYAHPVETCATPDVDATEWHWNLFGADALAPLMAEAKTSDSDLTMSTGAALTATGAPRTTRWTVNDWPLSPVPASWARRFEGRSQRTGAVLRCVVGECLMVRTYQVPLTASCGSRQVRQPSIGDTRLLRWRFHDRAIGVRTRDPLITSNRSSTWSPS